MAVKQSTEQCFIDGAIHAVASFGIESTRTKDVAGYAGFSEAMLFRLFDSKDSLLRESFLYVDQKISGILLRGINMLTETSFEFAMNTIWREVYRYLLEHWEETIFLIRYRYSSLYTDEVRNSRQAYNGNFRPVYELFDKHFGNAHHSYDGFLVNFIFEMTLCFAERVIKGKLKDDEDSENKFWLAINGAVSAITRRPQSEQTAAGT